MAFWLKISPRSLRYAAVSAAFSAYSRLTVSQPVKMRSFSMMLLIASALVLPSSAFLPVAPGRLPLTRQPLSAQNDGNVATAPQAFQDLEAAAEEAKEAAAAFGDETAHFMSVWLGKVLKGDAGKAEMDLHLIEECLVDDSERCQRLEDAIKNVRNAAGNWTGLNG